MSKPSLILTLWIHYDPTLSILRCGLYTDLSGKFRQTLNKQINRIKQHINNSKNNTRLNQESNFIRYQPNWILKVVAHY